MRERVAERRRSQLCCAVAVLRISTVTMDSVEHNIKTPEVRSSLGEHFYQCYQSYEYSERFDSNKEKAIELVAMTTGSTQKETLGWRL